MKLNAGSRARASGIIMRMTCSRHRTLLLTAVVSLTWLTACQSSEANTRFDPETSFARTTGPKTTKPTTSTVVPTPEPQWNARSFTGEIADGTNRACVELTTGSTVATTCLALPGVSSWTVAGAHFVVGLGDIAVTDGSVIRADASGVAIGFLPADALPTGDMAGPCSRSSLAPAVAEHYPGSTVAWVPRRCAGGVASVAALLEDRSEVVALIEQTDAGPWAVFATFRPPVRCKLLDVWSRNKCKLLRYDD